MLQDHLSEIGHLGQGCAESWFGWIKWRLFCFGRVKICCCWSFIPSGNAILRGNSWRNNMLSWSFRELYLHLSQEPCGATKSGPAKSSQCKGLLRKPGTFARTIPYRLHVEWLNGYVILMRFFVIPNCRTSFSNNIANKLHRRETLYEQSAHDKDRKMNTQVLHVYLQNKNTDYTHIHYTPCHISYSIL